MYKVVCSELGFDCNFVAKDDDKKVIVNNFCKHLLDSHDQYFPTKEMLEFIGKRDATSMNYEVAKSDKWFQGRKNFP